MKNLLKLKLFAVIFLSISFFNAEAQKTFRYQSEIENISATGFYKINLSPALVAKSTESLRDLRIMDNKRTFVPYIFGDFSSEGKSLFIEFKKLRSGNQDSLPAFIFQTSGTDPVSALWLKYKNTSAERTMDISGSDDLKSWYAIREDVSVQQSSTDDDNTWQSISLPPSTYSYYKVVVNSAKKAPINIIQAGVFTNIAQTAGFQKLPDPQFTVKDSSNNTTYIRVTFPEAYQLNKLSLAITSPKYFRREVRVYDLSGRVTQLLGEFELVSSKDPDLFVTGKTRRLELQIDNGDSPPLKLKRLSGYQRNQFVLAYLEKDNLYKFLTGDSAAKTPRYDLNFFTDSALNNLQEIGHKSVAGNPEFKVAGVKGKKDYTIALWTAIIVAITALSFLSYKMMGEVKGRPKEN